MSVLECTACGLRTSDSYTHHGAMCINDCGGTFIYSPPKDDVYQMSKEQYDEVNACLMICLNIVPKNTDIYDRVLALL